MHLNYIVYHENNLATPYFPFEDAYANYENIFVVADGIALDHINDIYPDPSDASEVADLVCKTIVSELKETKRELADLKRSVQVVSKKVYEYNKDRELYKNRENNGYSFGAAVFSAIVVKEDRVLHAVLDDCSLSIFSDNLVDCPKLRPYVDKSAKYFDANFNWQVKENRKVWRKEIRNHRREIDGVEVGYGAIDGGEGYLRFVQFGEEKTKPDDLICLYTDGFIKMIEDEEFLKNISESDLSARTLKFISDYTKSKKIHKEKTGYFIKYSNETSSQQTFHPANSTTPHSHHHSQAPKFPPPPSQVD